MSRLLLILCFVLLLASPVIAKTPNTLKSSSFEVTPLIGYRFGGVFDVANDTTNSKIKLTEDVSYGLLTAWRYDRLRQGEFLISHYNSKFSQHSDFLPNNDELSVTYAHVGGNVAISRSPLPLYVTGGLGITHFSPKDESLDRETRFSANIGLTARIQIVERLSLKLSARVYGTMFNSNSSIFCNQANCLLSISSDIWIQTEVMAGLTFAF